MHDSEVESRMDAEKSPLRCIVDGGIDNLENWVLDFVTTTPKMGKQAIP